MMPCGDTLQWYGTLETQLVDAGRLEEAADTFRAIANTHSSNRLRPVGKLAFETKNSTL